jgi:hypothetical protein
MRTPYVRMTVICAALALWCVPLAGQWPVREPAGVPKGADGKPNLTAPPPRTVDGKPDLSGLWQTRTIPIPGVEPATEPVAGSLNFPLEFVNIAVGMKGGLPYQPWALALWNARQADNRLESPAGRCRPVGILQRLTNTLPRKLIQAPGLLVILHEEDNEFRQIFTDGRAAPVDPLPAFNGYSTGKWAGDTLVVTTTGFKDEWWADRRGNPLTGAAKVTERFRRINYGHMELEITVDDPKAYTRPWSVTLHEDIVLNTEIMEYFCNENERDRTHLVGK